MFGSWAGDYIGTSASWADIAEFSLPAGAYEVLSSAYQQPVTISGSPIIGLRLAINGEAHAQKIENMLSGQGTLIMHRMFLNLDTTSNIKIQFFHNSGGNINVSYRNVKVTKITSFDLS